MSKYKNEFRIESTRLKFWDYTNPSWYYVTLNTKNHKHWFGSIQNEIMNLNDIGKIVEKEWLITKQIRKNVDLDSYIVMPNHFHAIIIIESRISIPIPTRTNNNQSINPNETPCRETLIANSLGSIMGQFKSKCTKRIHTAGIPNFYWQARYYDRIIRNESELINIRNYIKENPARWNLKNTLPENYKP